MPKMIFHCKKSFKDKKGNIFESEFLITPKNGETFFGRLKSSYLFRCHTSGAQPSIEETRDFITFRYGHLPGNEIETKCKILESPTN